MENNKSRQPSLKELAHSRHSVRFFTKDSVDEEILEECVGIAQRAPSNSNVQPWKLYLAQGPARERIVSALMDIATQHGPNVPPLPERFRHFRSQLGQVLYGPDGYDIKRDEPDKHTEAQLRNYEFFGAPVCGVVTMHEDLGLIDALGVGAFLQTLILALVERGLGACLQVSVTGYPEVVREQFGVPDDNILLCGIAIGYPDHESKVNQLVFPREEVGKQMIMLRE